MQPAAAAASCCTYHYIEYKGETFAIAGITTTISILAVVCYYVLYYIDPRSMILFLSLFFSSAHPKF
jgi:hypothetical protein